MWSDTLLRAEQQHLLRLLVWAALSIVAATALAALLTARRIRSPMLQQFAIQMAGWGVVIGTIAAFSFRGAALRDLAGAARLERLIWMNVGLDIGYFGIGATLAIASWLLTRRMSFVGAGVAIAAQGVALLLLELQFAAAVVTR